MQRGRSPVLIDFDKFLKLKEAVDRKQIKKTEACEMLGISFYTYQKYASRIK